MLPLFLLALTPAQCNHLYAIHDQKQSNSQLFSYHLLTHVIQPIGPLHPHLDLEALATHPQTHLLYASSGTTNAKLYLLDATTGEHSLIGPLGADQVDSLAFDPTGQLWGESTQGLLNINPQNAQSTVILPPGPYRFRELTWNLAGTQLYRVTQENSQHSALWSYADQEWQILCDNLPKKVEGLTTRPDGLLMYAFHEDQQLQIHTYDARSCQTLEQMSIDTPYGDIEALSWPNHLCTFSNQTALRAYLEKLPGFQSLEINPQGILTLTLNGKTSSGQLVDPPTPGIPTGELVLSPIEDKNCDGRSDFQVTYPSGDQQIIEMREPTPQTVEVHIITPMEGASLETPLTLVTGTYQGPPSTSIVVNGLPAFVDHGRFIANDVPIENSTLTAQLFTLEGNTATEHRTITTQNKSSTFQLIASTVNDFAPLEVTFQAHFPHQQLTKLTVDVNSDGQAEWINVAPETLLQHTYSQAGLYQVTAWATDVHGTTYQAQLGIHALHEKDTESLLKCSWKRMNTALVAGKLEDALAFVGETARPKYAAIWKGLAPYLPEIIASYSPLMRVSLSKTMAEFAITRHIDGSLKTFFIYYLKEDDGVWRLVAM